MFSAESFTFEFKSRYTRLSLVTMAMYTIVLGTDNAVKMLGFIFVFLSRFC